MEFAALSNLLIAKNQPCPQESRPRLGRQLEVLRGAPGGRAGRVVSRLTSRQLHRLSLPPHAGFLPLPRSTLTSKSRSPRRPRSGKGATVLQVLSCTSSSASKQSKAHQPLRVSGYEGGQEQVEAAGELGAGVFAVLARLLVGSFRLCETADPGHSSFWRDRQNTNPSQFHSTSHEQHPRSEFYEAVTPVVAISSMGDLLHDP